jgi:hypothetical protein
MGVIEIYLEKDFQQKKQDAIGKSLTSTNVCPNAESINLSCKKKIQEAQWSV